MKVHAPAEDLVPGRWRRGPCLRADGLRAALRALDPEANRTGFVRERIGANLSRAGELSRRCQSAKPAAPGRQGFRAEEAISGKSRVKPPSRTNRPCS